MKKTRKLIKTQQNAIRYLTDRREWMQMCIACIHTMRCERLIDWEIDKIRNEHINMVAVYIPLIWWRYLRPIWQRQNCLYQLFFLAHNSRPVPAYPCCRNTYYLFNYRDMRVCNNMSANTAPVEHTHTRAHMHTYIFMYIVTVSKSVERFGFTIACCFPFFSFPFSLAHAQHHFSSSFRVSFALACRSN